jgi:hypothetical protein
MNRLTPHLAALAEESLDAATDRRRSRDMVPQWHTERRSYANRAKEIARIVKQLEECRHG